MVGAALFALLLRVPAWAAAPTNDEAGSSLVGHAWLAGAPGDAGAYGAYFLDRPPLLPLLYGLADVLGGLDGVRVLGAIAAVVVVVSCAWVARVVAGSQEAAGWAAIVAAPLVSAATLLADHTYGELLAAAFTAPAVALLATDVGRARGSWRSAAAGVLAVSGVLVKQSAFDALVAGSLVVVVVGIAGRREAVGQWSLAVRWLGAVAIASAALFAWALLAPGGVGAAWDAIVGFRLDVVSGGSTPNAPSQLAAPLVASGLLLALAAAGAGIFGVLRGTQRLLVAAWLGAAVVGVLGGGYYWGHYLLQLVAPAAVGAGVWLAGRRPRVGAMLVGVLLVLGIAGPALRSAMPHSGSLDDAAREVGRAVEQRADRGDTIEVLYARPGVVHASGLRSTSPYLWSAMQAHAPGVESGIVERLGGAAPPTWVVRWNRPGAYGFDRDGEISRLVDDRYRHVATVRGRELLRLRADAR